MVIIVGGLIGVMSAKVSENPNFIKGSRRVFFQVDDAGGLISRSPVKMAGIRVGVIKDIRLKDGRALVELTIRRDIELSRSAQIEIRADGILGDKHVEILPGLPSDPPLDPSGEIREVQDGASMDRILGQVGEVTQSLRGIAKNLYEATEGDTSKPVGRIIKNFEHLTAELVDLVGRKKEEVSQLLSRLNSISGKIDRALGEVEGGEGLLTRLNNSAQSLEGALRNIDSIAGKIDSGQGTIGRLVNDEETVEQLNTAIVGVNNYLDAGSKIKTSLDYNSQLILPETETGTLGVRTYVGVRIQPGLDRFYELAATSTPEGVVREKYTVVDQNVEGLNQSSPLFPGGEVTRRERTEGRYEMRLTALFAKKIYDLSIKGGLIESRGGVGLEYNFFRNKARLSLDMFDFAELNLRAYARYTFFRGLYILGGYQHIGRAIDTVNDNLDLQGRDSVRSNGAAFFGGGLFLTNDDIKVLLSRLNF